MKNQIRKNIKNKVLFLMTLLIIGCGKKEPTVVVDKLPDRPIVLYAEFSNSWFNDFELVDYTSTRSWIIPKILDQFSQVLTYDLEVYIDDVLVCTYSRPFGANYYEQSTQCPYLLEGQRIRIGNLAYQSIVYMQLVGIRTDLIP